MNSRARAVPPRDQGLQNLPTVFQHSLTPCLAAVLVILSGCTVTPTSPRATLGLPVDTAKQSDGTTAGLWRNQSLYALTVRDLPAIQLPAVASAKILDMRRVGLATNVLIEARDQNCQYRYLLYSLRASSVRNWEVGNCRTPVRITTEDNRQIFNFYTRDQRQVFEYQNDRLFESSSRLAPSAIPAQGAQTASAAAAQDRSQSGTASPETATVKAVSQLTPGKLPAASGETEFPPTEKIPVVIELRR